MANTSKPITISVNGIDITESGLHPSADTEFLPIKELMARMLVKLEPIVTEVAVGSEMAYSLAKWHKQDLKRLNKGDGRGGNHDI